MRQRPLAWLLGLFALGFALGWLWFHPRVAYYRSLGWSRLYYALRPPEEQVFLPGEDTAVSPSPSPSPTPALALFTTPWLTATPSPISTPVPPTPTPWPLPERAFIDLPRHEYQRWNNCGPANLSMTLAYWGWEGDQMVVARGTKPNARDKNVTPQDMQRFVEKRTVYRLVWRGGGTLDVLKAFLAAGYPVLVEKGFYAPDVEGWMGHYLTLVGYDEGEEVFWAYDSYLGPGQRVAYDVLTARWRDFNYVFLVPYLPYREGEVLALLGPWADVRWAWEEALRRAREEAATLDGVEGFFAQFNVGDALTRLERYEEAALAFDEAFRRYAALPREERPWRVMWYHETPYQAYYYTGRYGDVINLANTTLAAMSEPVLEEAYYWRGMAEAALGDFAAARKDFQKALRLNPLMSRAQEALDALPEE